MFFYCNFGEGANWHYPHHLLTPPKANKTGGDNPAPRINTIILYYLKDAY